jgi:hypothetical protein
MPRQFSFSQPRLFNSEAKYYTLLNILRPDLVMDRNSFYLMAEPNQHLCHN